MTEKTKRKVNPRRRTLIRLLMGIIIIVVLVSAGMYALRPKGAQIVFIAPDDDGVDNIWIADLNDPEHPKQLTHYAHFVSLLILETESEGNNLFFRLDERGKASEIWRINVQTGTRDKIMICPVSDMTCGFARINPNGQFVAYESYQTEADGEFVVSVNVLNIHASEILSIFNIEFEGGHNFNFNPLPQWIGETNSLIFRASGLSKLDEFMIYDIEKREFTNRLSLKIFQGSPIFSDDGLRYGSHNSSNLPGTLPQLSFSLHSIDNPSISVIEPIDATDINSLILAYFQDWHPNNEIAMITETWTAQNYDQQNLITLYNATTGAREVITEITNDYRQAFESASFNNDGSTILYSRYVEPYRCQIMLYDMETREEIALPLFGSNPQWVNGGR